ncbi:ABC transporter permease [Escherichia coli]|uniref:ABC transporter permease n=1 Tax=Escherichia coli TaxID=562 RepID=A0A447XZY6_ECOLX|nr:ABC transporter permease [Escherichia coli]
MFHRLWTLIRKELQSLLREPPNPRNSDFTRADSGDPVPFAATLEVTNATIAIYDEDNGEHSVELTQRLPAPAPYPCAAAEKPAGDPPDHRHTKGVTLVRFPADFSRNWIPSRPRRCS